MPMPNYPDAAFVLVEHIGVAFLTGTVTIITAYLGFKTVNRKLDTNRGMIEDNRSVLGAQNTVLSDIQEGTNGRLQQAMKEIDRLHAEHKEAMAEVARLHSEHKELREQILDLRSLLRPAAQRKNLKDRA